MNEFSPIVLFTYLRLTTLKKTVNALANNTYAKDSHLIIFSDAAKYLKDETRIKEIRSYLKEIKGFKSVIIHESKINKGLAKSIIEGVSSILKTYPSAIILEDDLITSVNFLAFMNASLNRFQNSSEVYSISGYAFDFSKAEKNLSGYFLNRPNSWGWATWSDRWEKVQWDLPILDKKELNELSILGSDVKNMYLNQMNQNIDSWHIKFIYSQFKHFGLTFYPSVSKVNNLGFDRFATHTKFGNGKFITVLDQQTNTEFDFPDIININISMQRKLKYRMSLFSRFLDRVKHILFKFLILIIKSWR